ncbi:hypothetical protein PAXRUDRAFT_826671 [Paxillus rubicundulus Ve08.2h10]|uniref:Uncharacterized protein n=1 Tax=Paxillus rubicundulus Ve08.2h10 TaxID=930991 RepID=A0A0D0DZ99_9AGAM|nr:hypothetical protein PAXRUDRAFT_826671 [Paxillus rubicundulus Ve08.2h10]
MFGYGRYNAGVLIELLEDHRIDTDDEKKMEETRDELGSIVERMNMFAPQHSRVYKEVWEAFRETIQHDKHILT